MNNRAQDYLVVYCNDWIKTKRERRCIALCVGCDGVCLREGEHLFAYFSNTHDPLIDLGLSRHMSDVVNDSSK